MMQSVKLKKKSGQFLEIKMRCWTCIIVYVINVDHSRTVDKNFSNESKQAQPECDPDDCSIRVT